MQTGLGTHFNGWCNPLELEAVCARYTWGRIDAQQSEAWSVQAWMNDLRSTSLPMVPIVIVFDLDRLRRLPDGIAVEWGNEVDIKLGTRPRVSPSTYRKSALDAWAIAKAKGMTFYAGAIANLNRNTGWLSASKGIAYLEDLRIKEWDPAIRVCVHHYTDGIFGTAHRPYKTRSEEVQALERAIGPGRRWAVTEFGYGQAPEVSDLRIANEMQKEWDFWASWPNCDLACHYQIHDGLGGETYGLFRVDGSIKIPIYQVAPLRPHIVSGADVSEDDDMPRADFVISRSESFEVPGKPGCFATYYPRGQTATVLSIQPDGSFETRPVASVGAWETWKPESQGTRAHFWETSEHRALPLVD